MILRVGIENNNDGRSIAWALEHPGCFAYGQDGEQAQKNFPQAAREYAAWIANHGESWLDDEIEVMLKKPSMLISSIKLLNVSSEERIHTWSNPSSSVTGGRSFRMRSNAP